MEKSIITSAADIIKELERISSTPYKESDHGRNHQTFALALIYLIYKAAYPNICKKMGF